MFDQKRSADGVVSAELKVALRWWRYVLSLNICEEHPWVESSSPLAHLYVDARSTPARCAAVLFIDGDVHYTDGEPSEEVMSRFRARGDRQITSLEMLAISVGLSTFEAELSGRKIVLWSDNTGAEAGVAVSLFRAGS